MSTTEKLRRRLSALLMDTDEQHPMRCNVLIGESEAQGLSSLELPTVVSIFQQPCEGIIWFNIYGCDKPMEFDSMNIEDIKKVIKYLEDVQY